MKNQTKKSNKLFDFFYNYWITIILLVVLTTLIRQNFFINNFPKNLKDRQQTIEQNTVLNQALENKNQSLIIELNSESEPNMEILESQARYRFGLVKDGEKYYQISKVIQDPSVKP
ncbi:septum formation initiator family protein [Candidatus Thioglobus sp.]|uniref:FtsB family cell division protein n=1 Tax=Candidatus Thioglobus sp. TaxID=2026721 RepID=UPI00176B1105|nr:cell division protein FtsB [Candidatus Thioglobus sp.]